MDQLLNSRIHFFRRFHSDAVTRQFLVNEARFLSLIEHRDRMDVIGLINTHLPRNIRIDIPPDFFDTVPVVPSTEQLSSALQPIHTSEGECPICREQYTETDEVVSLRNCNHSFHRLCANVWYGTSVYCPICRNDIRATNTN
jgi:hypothetical protein